MNTLKPSFGETIGALAFLPAVYVVAYIAVTGEGDFRSLALGAIIGVVGAGLGFYLRAKVQGAGTGDGGTGGASVAVQNAEQIHAQPTGPVVPTTATAGNVVETPTLSTGGSVTLRPPEPPKP